MAGYGVPPGGTYEFNPTENITIADVARYARLWGIISLVSGALVLLLGIGVAAMGGAIAAATAGRAGASALSSSAAVAAIGIALVPTALVSIIGGIFYVRSGEALRSVVDTQGNDIALLTEAVRSLTLAFKIEAIAMAVGFVVGLAIGLGSHASGGQ
jgi:hypothetical protein